MKPAIIIFILFICTIIASYSQNEQNIVNYPFVLSPVTDEVNKKIQDDFQLRNGKEWGNIMVDKFTGFLQFATVGGMPEKKDLTDYKIAIKTADEFLEKNKELLGTYQDKLKCVNIIGKTNNPQLGYVWVEYGGQYQHDLPVEGTKIMVKVDYPGVVKEIRARWYPPIQIPEYEIIESGDIKNMITGKSIEYKGYGGKKLNYIIQLNDINEPEKVIFPLRKEKDNKVECFLSWKIKINKEDIPNAWTFYLDAFSGKDLYSQKNF